ncbi:hypothetical protein Leryth_027418 [Lithospermum erythrorhizon]|nr:hypothetical protein Leryth_027418 [Lithospermum erythrorhizon]
MRIYFLSQTSLHPIFLNSPKTIINYTVSTKQAHNKDNISSSHPEYQQRDSRLSKYINFTPKLFAKHIHDISQLSKRNLHLSSL